MIEQQFLEQIETAIENYDFHEIKPLEIGRNAPINQVVIQCFDLDGNVVYFAFDWEGWDFDDDCGGSLSFYEVKDDIYQVAPTEVTKIDFVRVKW